MSKPPFRPTGSADDVSGEILAFAQAHGVDLEAALTAVAEASLGDDLEAVTALLHNLPIDSRRQP